MFWRFHEKKSLGLFLAIFGVVSLSTQKYSPRSVRLSWKIGSYAVFAWGIRKKWFRGDLSDSNLGLTNKFHYDKIQLGKNEKLWWTKPRTKILKKSRKPTGWPGPITLDPRPGRAVKSSARAGFGPGRKKSPRAGPGRPETNTIFMCFLRILFQLHSITLHLYISITFPKAYVNLRNVHENERNTEINFSP